MKVLFIAAGKVHWGSSRMRAYWVADRLGADCLPMETGPLPGYDVYVWQKAANPDWIRMHRSAIHIWDVCDPAWWWQPNEAHAMAELCNLVVASSEKLAWDFGEFHPETPVYTIDDTLNLQHFPIRREHAKTDPVRIIWFGMAVNRLALYGAIPFLDRLVANGYNIELTVYDDQPQMSLGVQTSFPMRYERWKLENENFVIASHDIALLPPYPGAWGQVKSYNKVLTAWACGLPATDGMSYIDLELLVKSAKVRKEAAQDGYKTLSKMFTTDNAAAEWRKILDAYDPANKLQPAAVPTASR